MTIPAININCRDTKVGVKDEVACSAWRFPRFPRFPPATVNVNVDCSSLSPSFCQLVQLVCEVLRVRDAQVS